MDEPLSYLSRTQDAYTPKLEMEVSSIKTSTEFFILKNKIADIMYIFADVTKALKKKIIANVMYDNRKCYVWLIIYDDIMI